VCKKPTDVEVKSIFLLLLLVLIQCIPASSQIRFNTKYIQLELNKKGYLTSLYDPVNRKEYVFQDKGNRINPLLVLHNEYSILYPDSMDYNKEGNIITLFYGSEAVRALIKVNGDSTHVSFELLSVQGMEPLAIMWGPYATRITSTIGETIGVVRNEEYALGIQALNMHTMGGILHEYDAVVNNDNSHFRELNFNRAATLIDGRSELRAYTREREGGIRNSKIALFGCPQDMVLDIIGHIELAETLPHPMYKGTWGKVSPVMKENWMMTTFNEETIDEVIGFARKANLTSIHMMGPFETWGHFQLNKKKFPNGLDGLKACVEKAAQYNISIGIHSLSNFISTNDPYVTPVPDPRLACDIKTTLTQGIDSLATTLFIEDSSGFGDFIARKKSWNRMRKNHLKTIRIDKELIQYGSVSHDKPFRLLDCQRGAFGTVPAPHQLNAEVGKLWDHDYKVFFPSFEMQREMAIRLAEIINYTGIKEISFDGLEGCFFSGYNMYASVQFVKECASRWDHEVFCDASIINHNLWHYFSRMSWGDENYQSATRVGTLKFKNQAFYSRNYIPPMMGAGLKLTTFTRNRLASTVDDAEWQLSKNAGYDAGYGIGINLHTMKNLGNLDDIIQIANIWEEARSLHAFSEAQKERLRDPAGEWHLEKITPKKWLLCPVEFHEYHCHPVTADSFPLKLINNFETQPLHFTMHVSASSFQDQTSVKDPSIKLNGLTLAFPVELHQNEYLVYQGGIKGYLYDENWHLLKEVDAAFKEIHVVRQGEQILHFHVAHESEA